MDTFILPASTYIPPHRQARKSLLNTIIRDLNSIQEEEEQATVEEGRGRSRTLVDRSPSGSCSPVPSLTLSISSYYQRCRNSSSRDFDDLYDVSDSESDREHERRRKTILRPISAYSNVSNRDSWSTTGSRNRYPTSDIPSPRDWPTIQKFNNPPVSPTPPAKIPISPAVWSKLSLMTAYPPSSSATPSLDGSLTSDQFAASSAPPTPIMQVVDDWDHPKISIRNSDYSEDSHNITDIAAIEVRSEDGAEWNRPIEIPAIGLTSAGLESPLLGAEDIFEDVDAGVQLPEGALDTLRHLSMETSEPSSAVDVAHIEMREVQNHVTRKDIEDMTPTSETSEYSFSQLSIPSPGGFFSSLDSTARNTWRGSNSEPSSIADPSSAAAENFYNAPWNRDSQDIVQNFVDIDDDLTEGPPTAKQVHFLSSPPVSRLTFHTETDSEAIQEIDTTMVTKDHDEEYVKEIWHSAEETLDRTSVWLAEQNCYIEALKKPATPTESTRNMNRLSRHIQDNSLGSPMKKAVRFLDNAVAQIDVAKANRYDEKADPLFYQAFQVMSNNSSPTDSFIHRQTRFDALQASRASLPKEHVDQLLGNYYTTTTSRPAPPRPISMMPGHDDVVEQTAEQCAFARVENERQALSQVAHASWIVEATRYLCGGRLFASPANKMLTKACTLPANPSPSSQIRVLDLGGQPRCDWAWHCSLEFPAAKTYTVTCDAPYIPTSPSLAGPRNHRLVNVAKLWALPFPDNHFDAISARSLYTYLRAEKPYGNSDDYDKTLAECLRVLKPGGFLEFFLLDAEIVHAGPRGTAASVEFGFNLKLRGYDPAPSKSWLGKVRRAGLVDIKRAWMFLPMGAVNPDQVAVPETPPPRQSFFEERARLAEAVRGPVGSSADVGAVSGLVGSWAWEQWLVRLQLEMGRGEREVVEGVGAVVEEGRGTGAGWRCLSGWARKPL